MDQMTTAGDDESAYGKKNYRAKYGIHGVTGRDRVSGLRSLFKYLRRDLTRTVFYMWIYRLSIRDNVRNF